MDFKIPKIILLAVFLSSGLAQAALADEEPNRIPMLCERLLLPDLKKQAYERMKLEWFSRVFNLEKIAEIDEVAKRKLGVLGTYTAPQLDRALLVIEPTEKGLDQVKLHLYRDDNGQFNVLLQGHLPTNHPLLSHSLDLTEAELHLDYKKVTERYRLPKRFDFGNMGIEFSSYPDFDGVRRFVSLSAENENAIVSIGLDVPCSQIARYTQEEREFLRVKGMNWEFCRIPILVFTRGEATSAMPPVQFP
jgi:hypothetical protein